MNNIFREFFEMQYPESEFSRSPLSTIPTQADLDMAMAEVQALIHRYGELLEKRAAFIEDEKLLPAPKAKIKLALLVARRVEPNQSQRDLLQNGYIALSYFQPLSTAEQIVIQQYTKAESDVARLRRVATVEQKKIALASAHSIFPAYAALIETVFKEQDRLAHELKTAG